MDIQIYSILCFDYLIAVTERYWLQNQVFLYYFNKNKNVLLFHYTYYIPIMYK